MRVIIYILALAATALADSNVVLSDPDSCQVLLREKSMLHENETVRPLDGFVGVGWDDLMNRATIPILKNTFSNSVPVLQTSLDRISSVYTSYEEYRKETTDTISASAGGSYGPLTVSGSFSSIHQEIKKTFFQYNSHMFHSKLIYHAYTLITDGNTGLHDGFVARLQQVVDATTNGVHPQAKRLAELIIRDYGTHIVYKADVGALIEQETHVDSSISSSDQSKLDSLRASASASFLGLGHASVSVAHTVSEQDNKTLSDMIHESKIRTRGGPSVNRLSDDKGIFQIDEMVAFSNEGMPLDTLITTANLPMWDTPKIYTLQELIRNATKEYYERNTIRGCTHVSATNYNYQANLDDHSCEEPSADYIFSGIYQQCTPLSEIAAPYEVQMTPSWRCDNLTQKNFMSGVVGCPANYKPILISSIVHQFPDRVDQRSYRDCHDYFFFETCKTVHYTAIVKDRVKLDSYLCYAEDDTQIPTNTPSMFGGVYTTDTINVVTGDRSCPGSYQPQHLFLDMTVCLGYDANEQQYAVPFNGFFSCQSQQQKCSGNYTQHLIDVFDGCAIFYCVSPSLYLKPDNPVIKRPPFTNANLAASNYSKSIILAHYNDEQVVGMPILTVMQNYTEKYKSKMGKNAPKEKLFTSVDVEQAVEAYMNETSGQILDLIEKYPNMTWGQIVNLLSNTQPSASTSSVMETTITK
ncbi:hypothetical protein FO519_009160 [Halicephalobus sp. NKZ332]|nr:hypothetical protein FO519_009160 [Halicephalobus sp. NKZ332]